MWGQRLWHDGGNYMFAIAKLVTREAWSNACIMLGQRCRWLTNIRPIPELGSELLPSIILLLTYPTFDILPVLSGPLYHVYVVKMKTYARAYCLL